MFSRIREAIRIISYREPESGQDFRVVEQVSPHTPPAGKTIAKFVEILIVIDIIGHLTGPLSSKFEHLFHDKRAAMTTIAGALGAFLMWVFDWLRNDIQAKISAKIDLPNLLGQFFGHKLENTFRVMKGTTRGAA